MLFLNRFCRRINRSSSSRVKRETPFSTLEINSKLKRSKICRSSTSFSKYASMSKVRNKFWAGLKEYLVLFCCPLVGTTPGYTSVERVRLRVEYPISKGDALGIWGDVL